MTKFLFFFILTSSFAVAKVPSSRKLKNKLANESAAVTKIAAQIRDLEKKLGHKNDGYLESVALIEKLEVKIQKLKGTLTQNADDISKEYKRSQKALNLYLLESIDEENDESLLHKKIYLELLSKKLVSLKGAEERSNSLLDSINLYEQQLTKTRAEEESIYEVIVDLENQKKEMSQSYVSTLESKNRYESALDKIKAKVIAKSKISGRSTRSLLKDSLIPMITPLDDYIELVQNRDAIILKYKDTLQLKAPAAGKIVYTGELANYGKLIMIDHGNDIKSVLLGDINIKVTRGSSVAQGQLLGYTVSDPGVVKSLHYEIRKKSKPVNALAWISNRKNTTL